MIETNAAGVASAQVMARRGTAPWFSTPFPVLLYPFTTPLEHSRAFGLTLLFIATLIVRTFGLGPAGFSEDDINELRAVALYRQLDFTAHAEYPMLMKLADWASLSAAQVFRLNADEP